MTHVIESCDVPDEEWFAGTPDEGYNAPAADLTDEPELPASFTDAHVAEALAEHLRGQYLYVAAWGRWLKWDGRRWAHDNTEAVYEDARRWVIDLAQVMVRVGASADDIKRAATYRNRNKIDAALTLARRIDGIAAAPEDFDRDPDVLNVGNGVVDLRTGELHPHDPAQRITKLAPADLVPNAYHPDVATLLEVVERATLPWLQRLMGYAATGHTSEDVAPVLADDGSNGKTTFLEAHSATLGDYAAPVSPQLAMRAAHEPHPTIKADLLGRRLVWISETEEGGALRIEQVKALTGGDQISARYMYGNLFTFEPSHLLVIATNHRPTVNSTERAIWRRLRLVPFPFTYKPEAEAGPGDRVQDRGLRHRLNTGRAQREALLAWIVRGAGDWYREGLGTCAPVEEATRAWRQREDVLARFIGECLELDPDASTRGRELYATYRDWCAQEGRQAKNNKNFAADFLAHEVVTAAAVTKVNRQNVAVYQGVKVHVDPAF